MSDFKPGDRVKIPDGEIYLLVSGTYGRKYTCCVYADEPTNVIEFIESHDELTLVARAVYMTAWDIVALVEIEDQLKSAGRYSGDIRDCLSRVIAEAKGEK